MQRHGDFCDPLQIAQLPVKRPGETDRIFGGLSVFAGFDACFRCRESFGLLPVLFDDEADSSVPRFLRGWTRCRMRQFSLDDAGYEHMLRILTGQTSVEKEALGTIPNLPPESTTVPAVQVGTSPLKIRWTDELRIYGKEGLFADRGAELELLDETLAGQFRGGVGGRSFFIRYLSLQTAAFWGTSD